MDYKNKIAVITPTIRPEGLKLVQKALEEQEFTDFDWYVCSPKDPHTWATWIPDDFKGGLWTLNRAYNTLIKATDAELIVSWQDYTYVGPDCLDRFWSHYQYEPKMLVSGIGHKYEDTTWTNKIWEDKRYSGLCPFHYVEWNLCSCPRQALFDIGGFDEKADWLYYGMDGYQVNARLDEMGYQFYIDPKIETFSLGHGRVKDWEEKNGLGYPYLKRVHELKTGNLWPVIGKL